jgi:hypothetical protein
MKPESNSHSPKAIGALLCLLLVSQGCGAFRVFNKDKTVLGSHSVAITPCGWKMEDKFAGSVKDGQSGKEYYKYSCGETVVTIKDEELAVNGKSYGKLANATDSVKVDGSRVLVNGKEVQGVAETSSTGKANVGL